MSGVIIFDMDGVLIDSVARSIACLCGSISKHGLVPDYNLITENWGRSFENELIPILSESGAWPEYKKHLIVQDTNDFFERASFSGPVNLKEKLEALKDFDHELGIVTNRSLRMMEKGLADLDIDQNIFNYLHSGSTGIYKPDPLVFQSIIQFSHFREITFVGDSLYCDLPAAYNSEPQIKFIGITSIIHNKEDFVKAGVPENFIYESVVNFIDELLCA
jgi:HAD superfamily hydrolase (TIGR01549 family)